jgi:hypothetical protein
MMEAVRTFETSVDNHFTRQYNPEDSSEHHTRRRENLKSHITFVSGKGKSRLLKLNYPKQTLQTTSSGATSRLADDDDDE